MKTPVKATLIATAVVVALLLAALITVLVQQSASTAPSDDGAEAPQVVRPNSHVLDQGSDGAVTVVEFLDFECEACGAFYPVVEDLRDRYRGDITYVIRYFPLPGHLNSTNAAIAAQAAADQGKLEEMYRMLFDTQTEWGESTDSKAALFRSFAEQIGLDMTAYDASVASPETAARVEFDLNEGRRLGVDSTPTFFVDGEPLQLQRFDDLENAINAARDGS